MNHRLAAPCAILACIAGHPAAQTISVVDTRFENSRFGATANADSDLLLTLRRLDADGLATTPFTPVDQTIVKAGRPVELLEWLPEGVPQRFFEIHGSDLDSHTDDTDSDGIDDRTEIQAEPFVNSVDGGDAGNLDVFDVILPVTISDGVPGAGAGHLEAAHAADGYRFNGTAGSGVFVDITSYDSALTLQDYQLVDPYGDVVKSSRFGLSEIGPVTLPYNGNYLMLVGDSQEPGTGTYSLAMSEIPAPDFFVIAIGDTISDGVPAAGAGNLEAAGAFDIYTFNATAGQSVFFQTIAFSGTGTQNYRLIDPDGTSLFNNQFNLFHPGTVELPLTGNYTLEVGESGNPSTGTYSIGITEVPEPDTFLIVVGDTVSDGVPAAGAGNIEVPGAHDRYQFGANAGDIIFVDNLGFSGTQTLDYRIIAPDTTVLANQQFNLGDIATLELPQNGIYTLEVGEPTNASTGTYSISISTVPAADTFAIAIGDTVSDGVPGAGAGNIEVSGAFDRYTFNATAGDIIFVDNQGFTGVNTINYRIIAPDTTVVANKQFNLGDIATLELPQTGTYTLEVGEQTNAATGTYTIAVLAVPAPDQFAIAIGDTVSDGAPGPGAGNIEVPGAYDEYTFSATAGDTIFVDNLGFTGASTLNYRIIAPDTTVLADKQFNLGDIATLDLPQTGTYTLEVGEATNASTGTYTIAVTAIPDPDVFAITIGDTVADGIPGPGAGSIEVPGAYDHYTFSATAGEWIFVDALAYPGLSTMNYRLIAPDTSVLDNQQFNLGDMGAVQLPQTGTYTLEVGEANNDSTGTYSIAVNPHTP